MIQLDYALPRLTGIWILGIKPEKCIDYILTEKPLNGCI